MPRLRPVMLRRLKAQVAPDLPDRIEERRDCQLTDGQRRWYLAELQSSRARIQEIYTYRACMAEHGQPE